MRDYIININAIKNLANLKPSQKNGVRALQRELKRIGYNERAVIGSHEVKKVIDSWHNRNLNPKVINNYLYGIKSAAESIGYDILDEEIAKISLQIWVDKKTSKRQLATAAKSPHRKAPTSSRDDSDTTIIMLIAVSI